LHLRIVNSNELTSVKRKYKGDYRLLITFTNQEVKQLDLQPYLHYPVYAPLKDEAFCKKAKIADGIILWNDYIDFDPDTLYLESTAVLSPMSL